MPKPLSVFLLPVLALLAVPLHARRMENSPDKRLGRVHQIIDDLRSRLDMRERVQAVVVNGNPRVVSVERVSRPEAGFLMSLDEQFLNSLSDDELIAVIAHELGHVWIYSHHPYLHTELLANQIAMRVVSRESLKRIYAKLWSHLGAQGNLEDFLGPDPGDDAAVARRVD